MRLIASATTECARAFTSCGRFLRLPRFLPLGQPPSLAFSLAARVLAFELTLPSSAPTLISFPQCGHFMCRKYRTVTYFHHKLSKDPLPRLARKLRGAIRRLFRTFLPSLVLRTALTLPRKSRRRYLARTARVQDWVAEDRNRSGSLSPTRRDRGSRQCVALHN